MSIYPSLRLQRSLILVIYYWNLNIVFYLQLNIVLKIRFSLWTAVFNSFFSILWKRVWYNWNVFESVHWILNANHVCCHYIYNWMDGKPTNYKFDRPYSMKAIVSYADDAVFIRHFQDTREVCLPTLSYIVLYKYICFGTALKLIIPNIILISQK